MRDPAIGRWHVGHPAGQVTPSDGVVALTLVDAQAAPSPPAALPLHRVIAEGALKADHVDVWFPAYRGRSLVPLLSWLVVERLATAAASVTWHVDRQQGPDSVQGRLVELGWELTRSRNGRTIHLCGAPPAAAAPPAPASVTVALGEHRLTLLADYGVFSPGGVDAGTELLLRRALAGPRVEAVADVGVGYGPLAIGLMANDLAGSAVASDVDALALWLAAENARRCGFPLNVTLTDDPTELPPTPLTVCNVPTHIDRRQTEGLISALARRARSGRLLAVVHRSLETRYTRALEAAGLTVSPHRGAVHVVLEAPWLGVRASGPPGGRLLPSA
jgi:16S rRNA G1207 methylase RsmC